MASGTKRDQNTGARDQNGCQKAWSERHQSQHGTQTGPRRSRAGPKRDQNACARDQNKLNKALSERHQNQHGTKTGPKRWRAGPKRDQNTGARDQNGCKKSVVRAPPEPTWDQNGTKTMASPGAREFQDVSGKV